MSRKVLVVDSDVVALGAMASALRSRGLTVILAADVFEAVEQAFQHRPEVVLAVRAVDEEEDLVESMRAVPEIAETPVLFLVRAGEPLGPSDVLRSDIDAVITRVTAAAPREARGSLLQDVRGYVEQMPLVDLLQLLSMNRRTGVLTVTTSSGSGEVRLAEGEVIDAAYRRLEGEKALFRLLGQRDGQFAFTPGEITNHRRIAMPTSQLLMEAMHQSDEVRRRKGELSPAGEALMLDESHTPPVASRPPDLPGERAALARSISNALTIPRSVDDLLDAIAAPDLLILEAVITMVEAGKIRRITMAELTTPFAPQEQLPVLRSLVTRLTRPGFTPPPRLLIAAAGHRLPALAHAIRRISDAAAPGDHTSEAPSPKLLGTLRLGDGVELALTGLPADPSFAPLWPLALPGAAAVVRLEAAGGRALEAHCDAVEIMLIDAESLVGPVDVTAPAQVASLVRSALEMAAGV